MKVNLRPDNSVFIYSLVNIEPKDSINCLIKPDMDQESQSVWIK